MILGIAGLVIWICFRLTVGLTDTEPDRWRNQLSPTWETDIRFSLMTYFFEGLAIIAGVFFLACCIDPSLAKQAWNAFNGIQVR